MSLRGRMALGLGLITALVVVLVGVGAYVVVGERLRDEVDQSLGSSAIDVLRVEVPADRDRDRDGSDDLGFARPTGCPPAGRFEPAAGAQVVTTAGVVTTCIEGGVALPVEDDDLEVASGEHATRLRTVSIGPRDYRVITVGRGDGSAFQIARSLGEVQDVLRSMQWWLAAIGGAGIAAAIALGLVLANRTARPVERLQETTERIAATQDLTVEIPVGGPTEVAGLGRSFTAMVDALASSRAAQQRLVRDSSHELRTPLTSLRTNADILQGGRALTPEQERSVVEAIGLEVDELTQLVAELVELAGDEGGSEPLERTDLGALAADVVARARRRSGREVVLDAADLTEVDVRPGAITRAVSNLVENALKYSSGPVEVVVRGTTVEVRDHGPGIAPEDRAFVFDRFYRATSARTAPGSGLGLAIVKQAVEGHGGTATVGDRADGPGAVVGFVLPPAAAV